MPIEEWFDYVDCQCKCKYPAGPPNNNYDVWIFDSNLCDWQCKPTTCPEGQYFDTVLCDCACLESSCPEGYIWEQTSCECKCIDRSAECSPLEQFDTYSCQCVPCREPVPGCLLTEFWNPLTCRCECAPSLCPLNTHWEPYPLCLCLCELTQDDCASGTTLDPIDCLCVLPRGCVLSDSPTYIPDLCDNPL